MNTKKEFVLEHFFDNIFFIADKDHYDKETKTWKEKPMVIHGLLIVMHSGVSQYGISNDVKPELDNLREEARREVEFYETIPVKQHFR